MTDKQAIKFLEKKIERLEGELVEERLKSIPYVPYIPYEPYTPRPWESPWRLGDGTYIGIDKPEYTVPEFTVTRCNTDTAWG